MQLIQTLALLFMATSALGKCCGKSKCTFQAWDGKTLRCVRWECKDGTSVSMFECCGYGKCNIFCCNCDKRQDGQVCRSSSRDLLGEDDDAEDSKTDEELFNLANTAGDGKMTLEEFAAYLQVDPQDSDLIAKFKAYDTNSDGVITVDEMRVQ